ncbi:hypothetical protein D0860_02955 [Hortaea werneckii]|uniref:Uncharacterized protein n=1 Tax=Hortaea werneckii TaxID=91943 RepID=A0A3M7HGQ4_HORWE|nr:hypothetical protein D0860_02955 [Hortaea werneckii]
MSGFKKFVAYALTQDAILTSKYNKPFPVTLLPSAIGYWLGMKQGERQAQILNAIQAADADQERRLERIVSRPK